MTYRAVVFDLFGTLVDNESFIGSPSARWTQMLTNMAIVVDADPEAFSAIWGETWELRTRGVHSTVEACVADVCTRLGLAPSGQQLQTAAAMRVDFSRRALVPRLDALETLARLREAGYRIGLISNCIPDVPLLWDSTPLAALIEEPIFSCVVGLAKPDPRIYQLACERLSVEPSHALFIADGEGGELAGAATAGLQPVLIRSSYQDPPDLRRAHVEAWEGPAVSWLRDVLTLLEA